MSKKRFAIMGLAAILVGTTTVACGSVTPTAEVEGEDSNYEVLNYEEPDYEEIFVYKPYTPQEQIVEGNETAVNTISNFVNKDVKAGQDYYVTPAVISCVASVEGDNDIYRVYRALDYDADKYSIMFLFDDDTKVVEATPAAKAYVDDAFRISSDYKDVANSQNSCNGAVASLYDGKAEIILNSESGYNLSSIWGYDQTDETVYLIWVNHDCPIWENHF